MSKTLLEQAKEVKYQPRKTFYSQEEYELAIGWLEGEITTAQVSKVISKTGTSIYSHLALALRYATLLGKLKVKEVK